ncbi:sensor histidine kinase [Sulfoacidibacillus thermotolerans]|uniref:histidine kinase n=1 Tax=Sulfoacidibacillus thermotolerans TaxID=1765684 RepID=A0A2U3DAT5_SULT2|nr:HAMP domain-containing sensor histidine kinase [Sulfoacidibacillus thermotolerans]PWI58394.1 hypothetical protein BM613_04055 [Sulfoacidibacillus thermotolerans]
MSLDSDRARNRLSASDKGLMRRQRLRLAVVNMVVLSFIWSALSIFVYFVLQAETLRAEHARLAFFAEQVADQAYHSEHFVPKQLHPSDEDVLYALWKKQGSRYQLLQAVMNSQRLVQTLQPDGTKIYAKEQYRGLYFDGEHYQLLVQNYTIRGSQFLVQVLDDIGPEEGVMRRLGILFVIGGALGLLLSVLGAYILGRWTLRPLMAARLREQEFVADVSHELRTPLSVLQTHLELLLRHIDNENQTLLHDIEPIYKETKRMRRLVDDLLDLARMDAGEVATIRTRVHVSEVCLEVLELYEPLYVQKGIHFSYQVPQGIYVLGDAGRIRQLLFILLDNAYKYTERGEVSLHLETRGHLVELVIRDTGIGIAPEWLPRITERFVRGEFARTRVEKGDNGVDSVSAMSTGLGLAIAKRIVLAMQGKWHIASNLGVGTEITLRFPLERM